ncbi:MAG: hypothetical protein AAGJ79_00500 [Verrucomicrobiota bacterium]
MVSRVEPERYADTGFGVKDTPPALNARLFEQMMKKTPEERLLMGFDMAATARELVWVGLGGETKDPDIRREFFLRYHGEPCPMS